MNLLIGMGLGVALVGSWHATLYRKVLARLRPEHPAVWRNLGSPVMTFRIDRGWRSAWATHRFLGRRANLGLGDEELRRVATRYRVVGFFEKGIFLAFLVALGL